MSQDTLYVELVFRVHADGRRERFAREFRQDEDGEVVQAERPGGDLALRALQEAGALGLLRRVPIEPRRRPPYRR